MLASIFPNILFLAMTATATKQMKNDISCSVGLIDPVYIEASPDRPNIFIGSQKRPDRGDDKLQPIVRPLVEELMALRLHFPLTVVYGNLETIAECFLDTSNLMGPCSMSQLDPVKGQLTDYLPSFMLSIQNICEKGL